MVAKQEVAGVTTGYSIYWKSYQENRKKLQMRMIMAEAVDPLSTTGTMKINLINGNGICRSNMLDRDLKDEQNVVAVV